MELSLINREEGSLIFPLTTRTILFKQQGAYIAALKSVLTLQTQYFRSLDAATPSTVSHQIVDNASLEVAALKKAARSLKAQYNALTGDLLFAKREIAFGKLDAHDLTELTRLFHAIMVPVIGITTVIELLDNLTHQWSQKLYEDLDREGKVKEEKDWDLVMVVLHEPFATLAEAMGQGLHHAGVRLELIPISKPPQADTEATGDMITPGSGKFAEYLGQKVQDFHNRRRSVFTEWKSNEGKSGDQRPPDSSADQKEQEQMYVVLYAEELIYDTAQAIHDLVLFAERKVGDGTMTGSRLIYPDYHHMVDWFNSIWSKNTEVNIESAAEEERMDCTYTSEKDPEHLPAANVWETYSDYLRAVPRLLRSPESAFGFRVACATLSAGIMAFLRQTWEFYFDQRLIWAMIAIIVGWHMGSGQSVFTLGGRVVGTLLAVVISFAAWYIVDGHTA
jgi:hypothetical protein